MVPFDDALSTVLAHSPLLPPARQLVDYSLVGAVLAQDVVAKEAVPGYRASIVDGYAVIGNHP